MSDGGVAHLRAVLEASTGDFSSKLAAANAEMDKTALKAKCMDSSVKSSGGGMSTLAKGAGVAGMVIGGALGGGLVSSVHAAMGAQVAQAALDTAIKNSGQSVAAMTPLIEDAQKASRNLGFANSDTTAALAKFELMTGNTKQSVADLSAAEGVMRAKHVDLATASQLVGGAMMGNMRAAKQLGITVIPVTTAVDALSGANGKLLPGVTALDVAHAKLKDKMATGAQAVAAITEKVKGQKEAFAQTAAGGMAKFAAETDYIKESLGKALLPAIGAVTGALATFTGFLAANPGVAKVMVGVLGGLAVVLLAVAAGQKIYAAYQAISTVAMKLFTTAAEENDAALTANPIGIIVVALIALGIGLYEAWEHSKTFRDIVKGAFKDVKTVVVDFVDFFTQDIPDAFKSVIGWVRANWPIILMVIAGPFGAIVALALNAFGIRSALVTAFQGILSDVTGAAAAVADAIWTGITSFAHAALDIWGWIWAGISTAASAVVSAAKQIGTWIWQGITWFASAALDVWGWVWGGISGAIDNAAKTAGNIGVKIWNGVKSFASSALDVWGWVWGGISSAIDNAAKTAGNIGAKIGDGAASFGDLAGKLVKWIGSAVGSVGAKAKALGGAISSGISRGISAIGLGPIRTMANGIIDIVNGIIRQAYHIETLIPFSPNIGKPPQISHMAKGGIVPGTGTGDTVPTMLTPGEIVLNAAQQKNVAGGLSRGGGGGGGTTIQVNFNGVVGDPARVAQQIADLLVMHGRRQPGALGGLA